MCVSYSSYMFVYYLLDLGTEGTIKLSAVRSEHKIINVHPRSSGAFGTAAIE